MPAQDQATSTARRINRIPPYSEEAEKGVLGSILLDANRVMDICVQHRIQAGSFYLPAHSTIYECMLGLSRDGQPIDSLTLTERLSKSGELERVGGASYIDHLIDATPTAAHAEYYINLVRQKFLLRRIIECAQSAQTQCYDSEVDAHTLLGRVEQSFLDIDEDKNTRLPEWRDLVNDSIQRIEQVLTTKKGITGVPTGFGNIDKVLMGLHPGNLIILAARPSMGKTSLAMNMVEHMALGKGDPDNKPHAAGVFSLEMAGSELVNRMVCCRAGVSSFKIASGYISQKDHGDLVRAADALMNAPIFIDDTAGLDIQELRARARRMKKMYNIESIIVDYLQLLRSDAHAQMGREREIADVSGQLKAMAKELGIPVLVLSQLSRAPEQRDKSGRPRLSDLRDSGSIEQDADVVMLLRRPCKYDDDESDDRMLAIVDIAKHRNGPVNDNVRMNFIEDFTRFEDRTSENRMEPGEAIEEEEEF